jgi:membrane fusion protein, hemolysin D
MRGILTPRQAFHPVLFVGEELPSPLPRRVLWTVNLLIACLLVWATFGRLDVVAVADGRLVPRSQLKIVQPVEGGVLREIYVAEGQHVRAGEVLARMDMKLAAADAAAMEQELALRQLQLRRIDAELRGVKRIAPEGEPEALYAQVEAQRQARVQAYENSLAEERAATARAMREMQAGQEMREKLAGSLPLLIEQERAFEKLAKEGYAGKLMSGQRRRERMELEQDLRAQEHRVESARATIQQAERRAAQLVANYNAQLRTERIEAERERSRLTQEVEKLRHRQALADLRAPVDGVVKDLATHTIGSVLAPGAVLMTVVPEGEALLAEVWLQNQDVGFVRPGQPVKLKLATFPFQRYGMLEGRVLQISADASERSPDSGRAALAYRAMVELGSQELRAADMKHRLLAGMQLSAEIRLADRSVLEYFLSPVQKLAGEAARER